MYGDPGWEPRSSKTSAFVTHCPGRIVSRFWLMQPLVGEMYAMRTPLISPDCKEDGPPNMAPATLGPRTLLFDGYE